VGDYQKTGAGNQRTELRNKGESRIFQAKKRTSPSFAENLGKYTDRGWGLGKERAVKKPH